MKNPPILTENGVERSILQTLQHSQPCLPLLDKAKMAVLAQNIWLICVER
jgi:hypothetical protein